MEERWKGIAKNFKLDDPINIDRDEQQGNEEGLEREPSLMRTRVMRTCGGVISLPERGGLESERRVFQL